jgi:4-diphosphocytidyl-2-C-methyl-D-erythritol kinase
MKIDIFAPAKVNLFLSITGIRDNGYHELVTVMQPLDLGDILTIDTDAKELFLDCNQKKLAGDDNLVIKAARQWSLASGIKVSAGFYLQKNTPVAAGLGGGSSDAAACLVGLNAVYGQPLSAGELSELAARIGADVPFFLASAPALCSGFGEKVSLLADFPELHYVLINPGYPVSTKVIYDKYDLSWTNRKIRNRIALSPNKGQSWANFLFNDLERVTLKEHPGLADLKQALLASGARGCLISGSGPTVFGVYPGKEEACRAANQLRKKDLGWVAACRGLPG